MDAQAAIAFEGGETAALQRLKHYLWDTGSISTYFDTRNGMLGADYSTKFSPWLARGCISPRTIFQEVCSAPGTCLQHTMPLSPCKCSQCIDLYPQRFTLFAGLPAILCGCALLCSSTERGANFVIAGM